MHNIQRMERQLQLMDALERALEARAIAGESTHNLTSHDKAALVVAARIEEFCDTWGENIHRAGEGI